MKLINIQDSKFILARQTFHLIWALPAFEQIPEFRGLQEHCIIIITPPVSHLIPSKKLSFINPLLTGLQQHLPNPLASLPPAVPPLPLLCYSSLSHSSRGG